MKTEQEVLEQLRQEAKEAAELFSSAGQASRERTTVAGLLRVLGVTFHEDEIVKQGPELVDICFRDARFQVTTILDQGRPRNREVRDRADRIAGARRFEDLGETRIISSSPLSPDELLALVSGAEAKKAERYGRSGVAEVDLLVHIDLVERHLFPLGRFDRPSSTLKAWRSVSVVMERVVAILWAADTAPSFLRSRGGEVVEWLGVDSIFPKLAG